MRQLRFLITAITFILMAAMVGGCPAPSLTPTPTPTSVLTPMLTPAPTSSETVTFPDDNLAEAIRDTLGKPPAEEITTAELANLTVLEAPSYGIADLSGLEYCTNLTKLDLFSTRISDISPLSSLTNLTELYLGDNEISDISPLSSLTNLTILHLGENQISDISPLSSLTNLTWTGLYWNQISDISPLVENGGLGVGDRVVLLGNKLTLCESSEDMKNIRALEARGVLVIYE
jgi:Leucine-rich repeat (LRR) protein